MSGRRQSRIPTERRNAHTLPCPGRGIFCGVRGMVSAGYAAGALFFSFVSRTKEKKQKNLFDKPRAEPNLFGLCRGEKRSVENEKISADCFACRCGHFSARDGAAELAALKQSSPFSAPPGALRCKAKAGRACRRPVFVGYADISLFNRTKEKNPQSTGRKSHFQTGTTCISSLSCFHSASVSQVTITAFSISNALAIFTKALTSRSLVWFSSTR